MCHWPISTATAAELGITELITETTTSVLRLLRCKHNIATAAANFYGIVVAPTKNSPSTNI
ncbi:MAG: hypothetical protein IPJ90_08245 [Anaerolineaceae bacterium]|nr:hypothetical protein [Anaerolineaceae bacterium]